MAEIPNGLSDGTAGQAEMVSPALSCLGSQTSEKKGEETAKEK